MIPKPRVYVEPDALWTDPAAVEKVAAVLAERAPAPDARSAALSRAEAATLLAIREETDRDVSLGDHVVAIGDSLALLVVVYAIEEALGIDEIPDEDLRACATVGDLARAAERAMAGRPS